MNRIVQRINLLLLIVISLVIVIPTNTYAQEDDPNRVEEPTTTIPKEGHPYTEDDSENTPNSTTAGCTVFAPNPHFHTHTVTGISHQTCIGVAYQELTTCIDVEKGVWPFKYWSSLGCDTDSTYGPQLSTPTGPYSYLYGKYKYRVRARGGFQSVLGGKITYSAWGTSDAIYFDYYY